MEMRYDGTLVMPSSYKKMDEKEMTYVDGGVSVPNWVVSGAINLAIDVLVVGGARAAASFFTNRVRQYGAKATGLWFSKTLKNKLIAKGVASGVAAGACKIAEACIIVLTWATDPGGQLASYIDYNDQNPGNGYFDFG